MSLGYYPLVQTAEPSTPIRYTHSLSLSKSSFKEITQISALENRLVCGALSPVSHQRRDNWDLAVLVDPRLQVLQRVQRRIVEAKWVGLNGVVEGLLEGVVLKL